MLKVSNFFSTVIVCLIVAVSLSACGSDYPLGIGDGEAGDLSGALNGSGSSAQKPVVDVWRSGFSRRQSGVRIQYSPDGSGAGRNALLAGAVQFTGSDAYLKDHELEEAESQCGAEGAFDIPVYISPIVVFFNLPGVDGLNLRPATIARIFRGHITHWDDPDIKADNDEAGLPHLAITPMHRNDGSGTTQNFTEYLAQSAPEVWVDKPSQSWPTRAGGESAKGTAGVVLTTSMTEGAIAYSDDAEVPQQLQRVRLKVGDQFVAPSSENVKHAVKTSARPKGRSSHDVALKLDRATTDPRAYPLTFVSYHIICSGYSDPETAEIVKSFESYVVSQEGQREAADMARSVPLPEFIANQARKAIDSVRVLP